MIVLYYYAEDKMRKIIPAGFFMICFFSSIFIFAAGKNKCDLTIVNKTGTQVTQIIVKETENAKAKPQTLIKNLPNDGSVVVQVKQNVLYDIVLINTNERQFVKKRQTWETSEASIVIERKDAPDYSLWEKTKDLAEASVPVLEETGRLTAKAGKAVADTAVKGYKKFKEEDGLKKAGEALSKFTEAGLKMGVDITIEAGKIIARVSRYTMEKIEQEKQQKLDNEEIQLIDEYVIFKVID